MGLVRQHAHLHRTRSGKKLSSCLENLSATVVLLGNGSKIVLETAVVELHCAHGLGDERVIMLIWAALNDRNAERSIIFFEARG